MKFVLLLMAFSLPILSYAQAGKMYPTGKGGEFYIPNGDISFADQVIEFIPGSPNLKSTHKSRQAKNSLGVPFENKQKLSFGCFGELVVKFTDNVLVDIPGPDLFVFEMGKMVEPMVILVSKDNVNWIYAGIIRGGTSTIDLEGKVKSGEEFSYVKLIDAGKACKKTEHDGADIIGIAAIGTHKVELEIPEKIESRVINYKKTITVESSTIKISVWDNGKEDGDIISLNVNGEWLLKDFEVKKRSDEIEVNLKHGENYLVLHAENLGDIPPNTAAIKIDDGQVQKTIVLTSSMGESEGIKIVR